MLFSVTSIIFILCTTPSLVFSTEPCGKTGYGETRKNPCLCLGGFGDSNGKDAVCELGQVCTKGIYDSDTRNGTDAVCSLPIPCTDIDNRVPEGCIPSLCKGTDGGENNCRIGPCANTNGKIINPTICTCPGVDRSCSGRSRYCLSTGISDTNAKCFRACKSTDSFSTCMCLSSALYPNPNPDEIGEVCNPLQRADEPEKCDRTTMTCVKDKSFENYEDSDAYKSSQTILIISIVIGTLSVLLLFFTTWYGILQQLKQQRESDIVTIPLGGGCSCCCCLYRIDASHVRWNRHLLAHGLTSQEIQEKFDQMNTFMRNNMIPTCPTYKSEKDWIKPLALFVGGTEDTEGDGLFMDWVENGILVCPPQAQSVVRRVRRGRSILIHTVILNIVPAPEYSQNEGVANNIISAVVPGNNPSTNQGKATVEIREFR
jgi:hypothetical protein